MGDLEFVILPLVQMREDGAEIDLGQIRKICAAGLDKNPPEDRLLAWTVLCGVLPTSPETWKEHRAKLVNQYQDFIRLFGIEGYEEREFLNNTCVTEFGVPNNSLMGLIHGDIIRTGHHIVNIPFADVRESPEEDDILMPFHTHMRRIERVLYVFANCNRTLSYMQGFNEIVSVLYYVMASAIVYFNYDWLELETFVFYTFQRLLAVTKLSELFTTQDKCSLIHGRMREFMALMKVHLPVAYQIVSKHDIHPLHFVFKRMNLLFAQDQEIPGLVVIWDAMLARFPDIVDFGSYLMLGLVKMVEGLLDADDYVQTMAVLQKLRPCNWRLMLEYANKFWAEDHPE